MGIYHADRRLQVRLSWKTLRASMADTLPRGNVPIRNPDRIRRPSPAMARDSISSPNGLLALVALLE